MAAFDLAAIVEQARAIAAGYRFDAYTVLRPTTADDGAGGHEPTYGPVEAGACILTAGATRPDERVIAERSAATSPYVLRNLPHDTLLEASDRVEIGGRTFEVLGVLRTEAANVAVSAVCEERL